MAEETPTAPATDNPPANQTADTGGASGAPSDSGGREAPKPNGAATLAEGGGEPDKPVQAPAQFPENWREIMAGGDAKELARLKRFNSPNNVWKMVRGIEAKMSSGELLRAKPEGDPSDPAVKQALEEWRGQIGIPEKPEGYLEKLPNGLVIGDDDKPLVESFLADMHSADAPPPYVHKALEWYYANQEKMVEERSNADKANRAQVEDELRSEWGSEYRAHLNNIHALFGQHGSKELLNEFFAARMADGRPLGDHPGVLKFLAAVANELNPHGTITPVEGQTPSETIDSELANIQKLMADNRSEYWTNPGMQQRYRELLDVKDRYQQRKAS